MYIINKCISKCANPAFLILLSLSLLGGCVTQRFENNEPILQTQANRDEMAATRVSLGLGYLKMGDMSQAKLNLEKAKNFSPNLVQVHTAFAHYYETVGESTQAIESFEQALLIKADSADTLNNYGVFLCRQDQVAAAEVQFLKAIAVPSYLLVSQSYENLASCYLKENDFEKAVRYLKKAIRHSPNRTNPLLQMVRLQYAMENYKEAKGYLQKFERNTQRFTADSLALTYKLYWKLGQRRKASNYANMLVKMYPQSWEGKQYLLNELDIIPADDLAQRYQLTEKPKNRQLSPASNKRVVRLSPKKSNNTLYTVSVKTDSFKASTGNTVTTATVSAMTSINTAAQATTTTAGTASVVSVAASTSPSVVVNATQASLSTGAAVLSTAAIGAALVTTNDVTSQTTAVDTAVVNAEDVNTIRVQEADVVTEIETAGQAAIASEIEPTSTKPIAAKRDVPLPEAIIEPIIEAVATDIVVAKVNSEQPIEQEIITEQINLAAVDVSAAKLPEKITSDVATVDVKDALHTVESGQNLYNISVKYNVKLKALRQWNNISEKNNIDVGDKLYVVDPETVKISND